MACSAVTLRRSLSCRGWTEEQVRHFLERPKSLPGMRLNGGMRLGELLGLQWSDLSEQNLMGRRQ
jgi:integrase